MRFFALILLVLLLVPSIHAANLNTWNIDISLNDDRTSEWVVILVYDNNITRSDYFVLASRITGLEVITDGNFIDCQVSIQGLGTSIQCNNIFAHEIQYRFRVHGLVESTENLEIFKYRFSVTQLTGNFSVLVKLPPGAGLVEDSKLIGTGLKKFEPEWGKEGSDGRRIFFEWKEENPKLGEAINAAIVYEQIAGLDYMVYFAVIFVIIAVSLLYLLMFRRKNIRGILPVLTDGERKVMEILLREKKEVDQRKIVKETDFSKAKVSRVIQNLINRELIEKIRKGRNNLIKLKK